MIILQYDFWLFRGNFVSELLLAVWINRRTAFKVLLWCCLRLRLFAVRVELGGPIGALIRLFDGINAFAVYTVKKFGKP